MDDDLHDLTPGAGQGPLDDDPAVGAFRSALDARSRRGGDHAALLSGIERRARAHQRRRLAGTASLAVSALAVVIAVTPLALGGRGPDTAGPALRGSTASDPAAPDPVTGTDAPGTGQVVPEAAPVVTADSLLRPEDITFIGDGAQLEGEAVTATGELPSAGVCVDTTDGVTASSSSVRGTFTAGFEGGGDQEVVEERVVRWDAQAEADSYLLLVSELAARCSPTEVGLEGTGPWTTLDATALAPEGGQAQAYSTPFGGFSDVLVLVARGNTVVKIQALVAEADPALALEQLTDTAAAAGERAFAGATGPGTSGTSPADDSLAAS